MRQQGRTVVVVEFDADRRRRASDVGYLTVLVAAGRDEASTKRAWTMARPCSSRSTNPDRKLALTLIARSISPKLPIVVADDSDAENPGCPMPAPRASYWSTSWSPSHGRRAGASPARP